MGFFNFIQQQHAVRLAAHRFGQVAAFLVAHITGRCTDEPRDRMLFHELAHVDPDQMVFAVEHETGQGFAQLGFTHTRRPEKQEGAGRSIRIGQARTRAAYGVGNGGNGLVLPDHALVQFGLHNQQLVALALHQLGHRDAGGPCHHFGDFLRAHLCAQQLRGRSVTAFRALGLAGFQVLRLFQMLLQRR